MTTDSPGDPVARADQDPAPAVGSGPQGSAPLAASADRDGSTERDAGAEPSAGSSSTASGRGEPRAAAPDQAEGTRRRDRRPLPTTSDPGRARWHDPDRGPDPTEHGPVEHKWRRVLGRTASKAWDDSLFGMSSQAAFWCALSTAPMLLALLGLLGPIVRWINPSALTEIRTQIGVLLNNIFNKEVADNLIGSAVDRILDNQGSVVSVGLVISLWAGSSAMAAFVESITIAYNQHEVRHPVRERFFALALYLVALLFGIVLLPLLAIGPDYLVGLFPRDLQDNVELAIQISYFPAVLILLILLVATLYKVAPKHRHPWKRGLPGAVLSAVLFIVLSIGLRIYLSYVYSHGLTYGALATPITFLLFYYFASMAIIIGAQFNNALLEFHPPRRVTGRVP